MAKNFVSKKAITNCVNMKYSILFLTPLKSHVLLFSANAIIIFLIVEPIEINTCARKICRYNLTRYDIHENTLLSPSK